MYINVEVCATKDTSRRDGGLVHCCGSADWKGWIATVFGTVFGISTSGRGFDYNLWLREGNLWEHGEEVMRKGKERKKKNYVLYVHINKNASMNIYVCEQDGRRVLET